MPKPSTSRVPSYRRHKSTGQAVVTINGRYIYLGKWNSTTSKVEYDRLIAEFLALQNAITVGTFECEYSSLGLRLDFRIPPRMFACS